MIQVLLVCDDIVLLAKEHNAQFCRQKAEYLTKDRDSSALLICACWDAVLKLLSLRKWFWTFWEH